MYRWRLKPELESQFAESWSQVTSYFLENFDSLGSRLHKGSDGIWYAYAQWKSDEDRSKAFLDSKNIAERQKMQEAIEETFPEIRLEVEEDLWKKPN